MNGTVLVSIQVQQAVPATIGLSLQSGDVVETFADSQRIFLLSEGSELSFGENTKVDVSELSATESGARKSILRRVYGKIRAVLSPGHQKEDSAFEVPPPNTVTGVKFSHPEITVSYDPATETTVIEAYTVDMVIKNLITQDVKDIPKGGRAIIRRELIEISPLALRDTPEPKENTKELSSAVDEEQTVSHKQGFWRYSLTNSSVTCTIV